MAASAGVMRCPLVGTFYRFLGRELLGILLVLWFDTFNRYFWGEGVGRMYQPTGGASW